MRLRIVYCLMGLVALVPGAAQATIFMCRTGTGVMVTTDHLDADCLRYGGKELNPDGTVRRLVLTRQQQLAQDAASAQQRQSVQEQRQAQREQRALLARFPGRAAFDAAQSNDLETPQWLIASAQKRLAHLQDDLKTLKQEAQFYPTGKYPLDLRNKFEENTLLTQQEHQLIAGQQKEIERIRTEYAQMLPGLEVLWKRQAASLTQATAKP